MAESEAFGCRLSSRRTDLLDEENPVGAGSGGTSLDTKGGTGLHVD